MLGCRLHLVVGRLEVARPGALVLGRAATTLRAVGTWPLGRWVRCSFVRTEFAVAFVGDPLLALRPMTVLVCWLAGGLLVYLSCTRDRPLGWR